jgi:hypothetical protein
VKKSILLLALLSLAFTSLNLGCKAETKVDDDGASAKIEKE